MNMNDIGLDLNEEWIFSLKSQWKLGISIIKKLYLTSRTETKPEILKQIEMIRFCRQARR